MCTHKNYYDWDVYILKVISKSLFRQNKLQSLFYSDDVWRTYTFTMKQCETIYHFSVRFLSNFIFRYLPIYSVQFTIRIPFLKSIEFLQWFQFYILKRHALQLTPNFNAQIRSLLVSKRPRITNCRMFYFYCNISWHL